MAKARSSEGEPITGTASVSGAASASDSTEREEGGKKQINTQNTSITKRARLMCSAGLPKNISKSYWLFLGFNWNYLPVYVHYSSTGNGLKVAGSPP